MNLLKKTAIGLAATSMIAAPVAASATQSVDGIRAPATLAGGNELEGNAGWIAMAVLAIGIVVSIVILTNDDGDSPTSP